MYYIFLAYKAHAFDESALLLDVVMAPVLYVA